MPEIRVSGDDKTALKRALARAVGSCVVMCSWNGEETVVWSWDESNCFGRFETLTFDIGCPLLPSLVQDTSALKKGRKADTAIVRLGEASTVLALPDLAWLEGAQEVRVDGQQLAELARACGPFVGRDPARPQFKNVALARYGRALELRAGDGHGECKGVVYVHEGEDEECAEVPFPVDKCALPGSALKLLEELDGPTRVRVCAEGASWTCGDVTTWVRAAAVGPDAPAKVETREVARVDAELLRVGLEGLHGGVALRVGERRLRLTCPTRAVEIGTLRTEDEETR